MVYKKVVLLAYLLQPTVQLIIKRQIFRENLLPSSGGRVPQGAFHPYRIALNRLNQNGLFTLDGQFLQQRSPNPHAINKDVLPNTLKAGPIDTSYVIREPIENVQVKVVLPNTQVLPIIPKTSLNLITKFRRTTENQTNKLPSMILAEYKPLLQKLHDSNYL